MPTGDPKYPYCPNCVCANCRPINQFFLTPEEPSTCMFDSIAREYARRGVPMPTVLGLSCPCPKCSPTC